MKEKIIEVIERLKDTPYKKGDFILTHSWVVRVATEVEHLVNQEVERRIAETIAGKFIEVEIEKRIKERMPDEEERRAAASEHEHKESFGYSEMDKLTGLYRNIDFEAGANWACSRLTNPGDSQKTEGGGE